MRKAPGRCLTPTTPSICLGMLPSPSLLLFLMRRVLLSLNFPGLSTPLIILPPEEGLRCQDAGLESLPLPGWPPSRDVWVYPGLALMLHIWQGQTHPHPQCQEAWGWSALLRFWRCTAHSGVAGKKSIVTTHLSHILQSNFYQDKAATLISRCLDSLFISQLLWSWAGKNTV